MFEGLHKLMERLYLTVTHSFCKLS